MVNSSPIIGDNYDQSPGANPSLEPVFGVVSQGETGVQHEADLPVTAAASASGSVPASTSAPVSSPTRTSTPTGQPTSATRSPANDAPQPHVCVSAVDATRHDVTGAATAPATASTEAPGAGGSDAPLGGSGAPSSPVACDVPAPLIQSQRPRTRAQAGIRH